MTDPTPAEMREWLDTVLSGCGHDEWLEVHAVRDVADRVRSWADPRIVAVLDSSASVHPGGFSIARRRRAR
jgi:hypothetical protein